MLCRVTRV